MYNGALAAAYAEEWWDRRNPAFPAFPVDCTNFVSQCLLAGGLVMRGYPDRYNGWWLQGGQWSLSWAVAHSMRWFLEEAAERVPDASMLQIGDVICYDFAGDGRIDHTAIVTYLDQGVPYVNAHTNDSRRRLWTYSDSAAYSPSIRYYFFHLS